MDENTIPTEPKEAECLPECPKVPHRDLNGVVFTRAKGARPHLIGCRCSCGGLVDEGDSICSGCGFDHELGYYAVLK